MSALRLILLGMLAKHTPSPEADFAVASIRDYCRDEDHLVEMLHAFKLLVGVGYTRQELVDLAWRKSTGWTEEQA